MKRKIHLYLGGEDIHPEDMMPKDFSDFLVSFIKDLLGGKK